MSKCQKCGTEYKLQIIDYDTGKTESQCPTCNEEITFNCHNCQREFKVADTYECTWCGWFFCPSCHTCSEDCVGKVKFNKILDEINLNSSITGIMGFKNNSTFILYQRIGLLEQMQVQKVCPLGVFQTSAKCRIPRLYGILQGYIPKKDKDQYEQRLNKFMKEYFEKEGYEFNVEDVVEKGRDGREEKDVIEYGFCLGCVRLNKNYNNSKKVFVTTKLPNCEYLNTPVLSVKRCCPRCKNEFENTDFCPVCNILKGKNRDKPLKLRRKKIKFQMIRTCSCPNALFEIKKLVIKNNADTIRGDRTS